MPAPPDPFSSRSTTPHSTDESEPSRSNSTGSSHSQTEPLAPATLATPASPTTPVNLSEPLIASSSRQQSYYVSSPLNPNVTSRPESRGSMSRIASDESYTPLGVGAGGYPLMGQRDTVSTQRGSMLLYRLASDADPWDEEMNVPPPHRFSTVENPHPRYSVASDSGQSAFSIGSDSKYPVTNEKPGIGKGAFLPYAYDPTSDQTSPPDADDLLHDPSTLEHDEGKVSGVNIRGLVNVLVVGLLIAGVICLFTLYPIITFINSNTRNLAIDNNIQVNSTGQVADLPNLPILIDKATPDNVKTRQGWDGKDYELVFSDEFNVEGRSFYPGDDPFWEAVDLWYGATEDMEWYDPGRRALTRMAPISHPPRSDHHHQR